MWTVDRAARSPMPCRYGTCARVKWAIPGAKIVHAMGRGPGTPRPNKLGARPIKGTPRGRGPHGECPGTDGVPGHKSRVGVRGSARRPRTLDFGPARRPRPLPGRVASDSGSIRRSGRRGHTLTAVLAPLPGRNTSKNGKSRVRPTARTPPISAAPDDPGPYRGGWPRIPVPYAHPGAVGTH